MWSVLDTRYRKKWAHCECAHHIQKEANLMDEERRFFAVMQWLHWLGTCAGISVVLQALMLWRLW